MAKVLLVEDDNNLREIYEARLQAEGYTIVSAKDGEEALVVAKEEKPDLIISDVMMPKISGFEMLDILRNTPGLKDTKVIMLTALGQAEDQTRANRLGADRYLVKSQVTLEDIVKVSHELVDDTAQPQPANDPAPTEQPSENSQPAAESQVTATPEPVTPEPVAPAPVPEPVQPAPEPPQTASNSSAPTQDSSTPVAEPITTPPVTPAPEPPVVPASEPPTPTAPVSSTDQKDDNTEEQNNKPSTEISISEDGQLAAKTEAEESAEMDNKITDFLSKVTKPSSAPTATEPMTQAPQPVVQTQQHLANKQADNDQTLAQAVNNLVGDTTPPAETPIVNEPVVTPESNVPVNAADPAETDSSAPINGKKIIKPLDTPPEKSLEELVAEEEAGNIIASPGVSNQQPALPNQFDPSDPNNIAI